MPNYPPDHRISQVTSAAEAELNNQLRALDSHLEGASSKLDQLSADIQGATGKLDQLNANIQAASDSSSRLARALNRLTLLGAPPLSASVRVFPQVAVVSAPPPSTAAPPRETARSVRPAAPAKERP